MSGKRRVWKTCRNLLCALLAVAFLWLLQGAPLLTAEARFRRLQREQFVQPYAQYQGTLRIDDRRWAVGLTQRWLLLGDLTWERLYPWPREGDGPVLAPVEDFSGLGQVHIVAAGAPEGTASARLELSLRCWYAIRAWSSGPAPVLYSTEHGSWWPGETPVPWARTYHIPGIHMEEGAFQFSLVPEDPDPVESAALHAAGQWTLYWWEELLRQPNRASIQCTMTAVFYSESGAELGRVDLADLRTAQAG